MKESLIYFTSTSIDTLKTDNDTEQIFSEDRRIFFFLEKQLDRSDFDQTFFLLFGISKH